MCCRSGCVVESGAECPEDELALVHSGLQWFVQGVAVCCSVLQCVAVWHSVVKSVAEWLEDELALVHSVLQWCRVLQCVAVCCIAA